MVSAVIVNSAIKQQVERFVYSTIKIMFMTKYHVTVNCMFMNHPEKKTADT